MNTSQDRNSRTFSESANSRLSAFPYHRATSPWHQTDARLGRRHACQRKQQTLDSGAVRQAIWGLRCVLKLPLETYPIYAQLTEIYSQCLVECPCYFGTAGIKLYVSDPNIKFILTTRSPQSFSKSLGGTLGTYYAKLGRWPFNLARYFDTFIWELERMFGIMTHRWSDGLHPDDAGFGAALEKNLVV